MAASTAAAAHVDKGSSRHGRPGGGKSRRPKHTPVATQRTEQPKRKGEDFLTPRGQGGTGSRGARKGEGDRGQLFPHHQSELFLAQFSGIMN